MTHIYFLLFLSSMSLISPNFDVKSITFFPILARDLFPKLLEKALSLLLEFLLYKVNSTLITVNSKLFR